MLDAISAGLETAPVMSAGDRKQFVLQTALADDEGKMGRAPDPMPRWLGNILAWVLEKVRLSCTSTLRCLSTLYCASMHSSAPRCVLLHLSAF